ncbi:MAG: LytR C-terminal domain-containing protein [Ilumatobacter sp.]|nr:LytR C-terminal domain-containing protein [Ilumatobacter sp.]
MHEQIRSLVDEYEVTLDGLGDITVDEVLARADPDGRAATALRRDRRSDPSSSRLGLVAAVCLLIGGLVAVLAWTGREQPSSLAPPLTSPPGTQLGDSTPTTLVSGVELFVWPGPDRSFATVGELVGAFVDTQLGWTAYDLVGDTDDQQQPQSFTLQNGDLGADVPVIAVPSPNGWGFVQVGDHEMSISVGPSVDGGAPVLTFVPIDGAVTHSITALLTHGGSLTFESATSPVEIPVEPNIGVASVLVLGQDAAGVVIGATGGQFLIADDVAEPAPTAPPTTAADTTAPIVSAESTVPVDSALAAAMQVDGRVLVLNATTTGGIAGDLTARLRASGYDVAEPDNAAGGVRLAASIVYTQPDMPNSMLPTSIANVLDIGRWETIGQQDLPALTPAMIESNDLIIVLGDDLADAPWRELEGSLIDGGVGRLLILDATSTDRGRATVDAVAVALRADGVDVVNVADSTVTFEGTMLMPIAEPSAWTFAVAELAGVGGFDTWTPSLLDGALPPDVGAVLVVGEPG